MGDAKREFAKGDRVRARTGGPTMTVQDVYAPVFKYRYRCVWTDDAGVAHVELFKVDMLEPAPEAPGPTD
jgi:uncharacterized protein YodC (DUF2158 family)